MTEAIKRRDIEKIIEKVDAWKKECVHIGIAGLAMTGKTSFINAMLGKTIERKVKIGQGNTTIYPTLYHHPKYQGLKFLDCPGYGTPEFPLNEKYLTAQHFEHCDLVLVFYASVLMETDIRFINHLVSLKQKFALVKTRADDLKNVHMKHESFDTLVRIAKEKCQTTLKEQGIDEDVQIFFISNIIPSLGDFDDLINFLTKNVDDTKRMHILMTLNRETSEVIDEKKTQLLGRAWKAAIAICMSVALPVPGIDIAFNMVVLIREIKSYLDVFHLDKESLKLHPAHHVKKLKTCQHVLKSRYIKDNLKQLAVTSATAAAFEIAIPVFRGIANGRYSVSCMYNFLKNVIADLANDAKTLMKLQNESFV
ncbi:hypothetical protein FSP39_022325 [Pinctada imbricata]|uniref:IRG-type G domain-containing protein n=1 Tax=Pinctada imbricata TaxID=66713 RepID=A0AA89C994_PINIB|nr:hypothetical protein FSP39_022325 [Pinctada imbricata]